MGLISFLMGSDGRKSLKKLNKIADKVEALDGKYAAMDDAELKSQTDLLKGRLAAGETLDDILPGRIRGASGSGVASSRNEALSRAGDRRYLSAPRPNRGNAYR